MKKQLLLVFLIFCVGVTQAQSGKSESTNKTIKSDYFAYSPDGRIQFQLHKSKIVVKFENGFSFNQQAQWVKKYELLKPLQRDQVLPSPKVSLLELKNGLTEAQIKTLLEQLNQDAKVIYANPFLQYQDGTLQGITDKFFVKLKNANDIQRLREDANKYGFLIGESNRYDPLFFYLETTKQSKGNALAIANALYESGRYVTAEPDYLLLLKKFNTNDTFLGYQWSLNNTGSSIQYNGTPGCDMNVFNAWGINTGNASTKVAIIDEGVDLVHPDLAANILPGYDGTQQNSGGAPQGDDAHGTACAGIVAAVGNNNQGIAGVAYNAKIVPVRIAYSSGASWVTSNAWIGASIDWAWDQGDADVLSNSWGGGGSSTVINDAITRATTLGRGGLGAPVLFAAGNSNGAVSYPATLANVISVTAMSMCNQRKSTTSCDGESFWGSNYGTNTDISAPGVKIYTCDISGGSGYSAGDYTATFNGTSSACPNAAGVMALIISVNPSLSMTQARQIIESSCDKVGGYTYNSGVAGQPNGTWSTELGHGKVNAFAAIQLANPQPCVGPPPVATTNASPSTICSPTTINLTLSGILYGTGQTYQWQSSSNNTTYTNISGANSSTYNVLVSATTWYRCVVTCGTSTNSTPVQVLVNNPTVSTFPHTVNFDASGSLPCGWTAQDVNNDGYGWKIGTLNSQSAPNNLNYSYNTASAANDWAFSAPLQLTAGTNYQVRFSYRVYSASYPENLELKWGNAANAAGMTSNAIFSATSLTNTTYLNATSSVISPTTSGIYYIGFRAFSNADMWDIHIDDVIIEVAPVCTTPPVGGTISGPTAVTGGTPNSYSLAGSTGNIQWQQSVNNTTWTNVAGATSTTASVSFLPGTGYLRAELTSPGCVTAYSNTLTITATGVVGDIISNPIQATLPFTQTISNASGSGYFNDYSGANNQASADFFIQFTTGNCADSIKISTCGTAFDSYIHLLTGAGAHLVSNDDNGPYCTGTAASLKYDVQANTTYIAVFEGYNTSTGNILINIENIGNVVQTLTATASGPTTFCAGGSVTLTVTPSTGIVWNTGATTPSITVNTSGNYFATQPGGSGCTPSSNIITVTANPLPVVTAGNVSGCTSTPINLIGSPAGGTFSIPNPYSGPSTTYTYTYTDANGCTATSAPATVTITPGTCYCVPTLAAGSLGCTDGDMIARLILNTLDNLSGAGCPSGLAAYSDYSANSALSTTLTAGTAYDMNIYVGRYPQSVAMWMDLNDDGIFDNTERLAFTASAIAGSGLAGVISPTFGTLNFTVPCGTAAGPHRMRVRCNYATAGNAIVPCASTAFYGEVEDYTIVVTPCASILNLKVFLSGYYMGSSAMNSVLLNQNVPGAVANETDDITVELHDAAAPYATVATVTARVNTNGNAVCTFPSLLGNYYVVVRHRNSIPVWSATPVSIAANTSYDFTTAAGMAYGNNQVEVETNIYALYSGDVNQDDVIDAFDYLQLDGDITVGAFGYVVTDLTGDGFVDAFDYILFDPNLIVGISTVTP